MPVFAGSDKRDAVVRVLVDILVSPQMPIHALFVVGLLHVHQSDGRRQDEAVKRVSRLPLRELDQPVMFDACSPKIMIQPARMANGGWPHAVAEVVDCGLEVGHFVRK